MEFKAVIFRDDIDENAHMCLLHEDFSPTNMPTLCVSDDIYRDKLTTKNFFIGKVDFIPNRRFDGTFEIMQDFDKFDYMISSDMCFEVQNKEDEDFTVHQMIRDGKFWRFVKYLAEKHKLQEDFEYTDPVGNILNKEGNK
jgi:hypothetical protein